MAFSPYGRCVWSWEGVLNAAGTTSTGPLDIHDLTDLWLAVDATGSATGTSPTLTVQIDVFDNFGNVFPAALALTELTSAPGQESGSIGLHVASPNSRPLPMECQVTYTVGGTNPVFSAVAISLFGR